MTTIEEIQSWPEVPSIAHFCSLFGDTFDLLEFEIEELEKGFLVVGSPDDHIQLVPQLLVKLLVGCIPGYKYKVDVTNVGRYLQQFFQTQQEEAEEDGVEMHIDNPFEDEEDFSELSVKDKVRVLRQLTQFRLEVEDASDKIRNIDPESLRVEPLGEDHLGTTYWYFYGTRLYKEVNPNKMKKVQMKEKKDKEKRKKDKEKKKEKQDGEKEKEKQNGEKEREENKADSFTELGEKSKELNTSEEIEEEDVEMEDPADFTGPVWSLVCSSEEEWKALANKYKKSRKKQDKDLYETLNDNFIPELTKMWQKSEREEKMRLLMLAPKRTSSRIQVKKVIEESIKADVEEQEVREREEKDAKKRRKKEEEASKDREWRKQQREERLKEEEEERVREEDKKREMIEGRAERAKERIREG